MITDPNPNHPNGTQPKISRCWVYILDGDRPSRRARKCIWFYFSFCFLCMNVAERHACGRVAREIPGPPP